MLMWLVKVILQHCRCGYQYLPHTYRRPAMDTWGTKKFFVFFFFSNLLACQYFFPSHEPILSCPLYRSTPWLGSFHCRGRIMNSGAWQMGGAKEKGPITRLQQSSPCDSPFFWWLFSSLFWCHSRSIHPPRHFYWFAWVVALASLIDWSLLRRYTE